MIDLYELKGKLEAAGFVVKVGFDHPFASMSQLVCHGVTVREDGNVWGDGSFFNWRALDIIRSHVAPPAEATAELREPYAIPGLVWIHEDELPEVTEDQFIGMFAVSIVDGVRMYPAVTGYDGAVLPLAVLRGGVTR